MTDQQAPAEEARPRRWLTRGVVSVDAASFFSDAGQEREAMKAVGSRLNR